MKRFREKLDVGRLGRREKSDDSEIISFGEWAGGDVIMMGATICSRRIGLG